MKALFLFLLTLTIVLEAPARSLDSYDPRARTLLTASLDYAEKYWDSSAGMLRSPLPGDKPLNHRTRESAWYALGLLMRQSEGDKVRALEIIERVLALQLDAPGEPWDGTFARTPEEPKLGPGAQLWKDFDPNWRQFVGTTFVLMLEEYATDLPRDLVMRMERAIRRAVETELSEGRAEAYHTNIALMHAFLLNWGGARFDKPDWAKQSAEWAKKINSDFARHGTFEEYNSPTYYGVDLFSLALWRRYGSTDFMREVGRELEAALWRDIAEFYHPGLRNLCGPYDRAYGLDMRRYVSLTGIWMGLALPENLTPLPDPRGVMGHAHDFFVTPAYVALGVVIPSEVLPALTRFSGERKLERIIGGKRKATAWIGADLMLGGEVTELSRESGPGTTYGQFHPATAHWRIQQDNVGAIALVESPAVDATAEEGCLKIVTKKGASRFRIAADGLDEKTLSRTEWVLPALRVQIVTDAVEFRVVPGQGYVDVVYRDATGFDLRFSRTP
jgi:hypothetical protein